MHTVSFCQKDEKDDIIMGTTNSSVKYSFAKRTCFFNVFNRGVESRFKVGGLFTVTKQAIWRHSFTHPDICESVFFI